MIKTIKGKDGQPYINLEDLMDEIVVNKQEIEEKISKDYDESSSLEERLDFLDDLYDSLKSIRTEYYKKLIGI